MKKALFAAALLLTALAAAPASAQRDCLRVADIRNWWATNNNRTLMVEDSWRNTFQLSLIGTCSNLRFRNNVAFRSRGGSRLSCLTPGDSVIARDRMMGNSRCAITRIERVSSGRERRDRSAAATSPGGN
jgi:hypothetical protein